MKKLYPSSCTKKDLSICQIFSGELPLKIPPTKENKSSFDFMMKLAFLFLLVFGMQIGFAQAQTNLALGKTVTSSSNLDASQYPNSNLVDGSFSTFANTNNTFNPTNAEWFMVDLGSDVYINSVKIGDRAGSNRARRFMIVTFPSIVATQNPSLFPAQGGAVNPRDYMDGSNSSLYNRLIYTDASTTSNTNFFGGPDGGTIPGPAGQNLGPVFPGKTASVGGQLSLNVGLHKARYVMIINLQDDYFDPTELQVFEAASPFIRAFVNGSFEQGSNSSGAGSQVRENLVPGWSTTEAVGMSKDNGQDSPTNGSFIEFWSSASGVPAKAGNYFVELNAFTNGMLEQRPICVLNGETFTWSFAHRGRGGVDVMSLRINDIDVANFSDNNAAGGTHSASILTPANTTLTSQATDANGWTQYTGTWRNTTGSIQKVSYGYRAVSSAGGNLSAGNFIDNVSLTSLSTFVSISSATATGPENTPTANLPRLLISGTTTTATTIELIVNGTATRGSDYTTPTASSGNITVTVPAGTYDGTTATGISLAPYLRVSTDLVSPEPDETITLTLANPSSGLAIGELSSCTDGQSTSTYTITDSCIPATVTGPASGCVGGSTLQLTGSDTPATNNPWVSSNPGVATVDNTGLVTPVSAGNTTITYTNSTGCTATIVITINPQPTITGTTSACIGSTSKLTGSATAATNNPWVSSNTAIATVSNTGLVTGVAVGTAVITYTNSNGCSQQVTFTVNELPTITGTSTVCVAGTTQLTGSATAATNNPWVSSNTAIATVNNTGLVTGVAAGTATITYTNSNGCTKQLTVTVNALPTITGTTTVCVASTTQLTGSGTAATTDPWVSSNTAIATVNNTGLVTGIAAGSAVITYTNNNGCTRQVTITVNALPTITGTTTVCIGATSQLTGSATAATTNPWVSSNTAVATVSNTGLVTSVSAGTTTITYTNTNGCSQQVTFTVNALPSITGTTTVCIASTTQLTGSGTAATNNPWVSSNTSIATVSNTGLVTGVAAGTATITYTNDNGCTRQVTITVNALPTITGTTRACVGKTSQLTGSATAATTNPWVSSDTGIATVSNTGLVTGVSAGTATITYTNSNGCSNQVTFTVNALPLITGTTDVCIGSTTQLTGSGTPATSNPWTSSATSIATVSNTGLVTGVAVGTATITYTNNNGCSQQVTVTVNALPTITGTTTVCVASTTQLTGSGTAATTDPWVSSNTAIATVNNTGLVTGIAAGSAVITYTNNNGCTRQVTITVNALPTITGTTQACVGNTTQLTGSGTPASTNPWVSSNTAIATVNNTGLVTGIAAGTAIITYTNINGCSSTTNVTINALPAAPTVSAVQPTCTTATGTITVNAPTGSGLTYSIDGTNYQASTTFNNVASGTYSVTVRNSNGCTSATTSVTINPQPATPAAPTVTTVQPTCTTATGSITVTAPTGSGLTYSINGTNYQASTTFNSVASGTYSVTVRNSDGCTSAATSVTINPQPATPAAPTVTTVQPTCTTATGSITVTAPTGSGLTYSINGTNYQASTTFNNVASGTYSVTVRNSNGCTSAATSVTINPQPATPAAPTVTTVQPTCTTATGSITVTAPTGSGLTYSINGTNYQASTTFNNVASGTYSVTVRNSNGCTSAATSVTINPQPATPAAPTVTTVQPTCTTATGSITVTAPTGSSLTYSIDGTNYQASASFTNVASGTYSVTVRNSDGCTSAATSVTINPQPATPATPTLGTVVQPTSCTPRGSFVITNYNAAYTYTVSPFAGVTITGNQVTAPVGTYTVSATLGSCTSGASASVTLTRPATLTAVISSSNNVNCFGASTGSATVSVTGGTSPYTYSWNSNPAQTSATANNLAAGTYTVTVTDASGCSTTQDVTITQPAAGLSITGTVINSTCGATSNGSVDITLSGGTTPYTYLWDSGETTQDISNKGAGTYTVTVTDAKSCSTSSSFTVTAGNCQPIAVNDFGNTTPGVPVSGNASTNDTPSGDGGNVWSLIGTDGGATLGSVTMNTDGSFTYTPKPNTSGTDTFTYHVCDVDGDCSIAVVTITIDASTLSISTTGTNVKCYGNTDGSATVTATGGTAPYTYSWNTSPIQTTATANNLAAGSYTVTVTDNVGTIRTENITVSQPSSALVANVDIPPVDVKCFGQNTGSATASASGGTGPYTYSWNT
ncbi:beta strand repeat-containing protein [Pedobacter sp. N23S346]|uniref:beta strand repeat-containing protein n=1 Tax=Pedobacter sp. N23S346 TaxID=3402750 RepID=UPI003ABF0379